MPQLQFATLLAILTTLSAASSSVAQERLERRPGYVCPLRFGGEGKWTEGESHLLEIPKKVGGTQLMYRLRIGEEAGDKYHNWYLTYNDRRAEPSVTLAAEPGAGSDWKISEGPRKKNQPSGFGYKVFARISPVNGPMQDWILVLKDGQLQLAKEGDPAPIYAYIDDLNDGK